MADYYAVLKKAISGLGEPTGEARRALYEKARNALLTQLKAMDPPLTATEITQQRLQLEESIRKVEAEATRGLLKEAAPRREPAAAATPPAPPPAGEAGAVRPARPAAPRDSARPAANVAPAAVQRAPEATPAGLAAVHAAPVEAAYPSAAAAPDMTEPAGAIEQTEIEDGAPESPPRAQGGGWGASFRRNRKPASEPSESPRPAPALAARMPVGEDSETAADPPAPRRGGTAAGRLRPAPRLVAAATVLVAVVGLGTAVYAQRDTLKGFLTAAPEHRPVVAAAPIQTLPPKSAERLGDDAAPPRPAASPTVRTVTTEPIAPQIQRQPAPTAAPPTVTALAPQPAPILPPVPAPPAPMPAALPPLEPPAAAPAPAPSGAPLVAHQAFLYEEGAPGTNQGMRLAGTVVWQTVQESDPTGAKGDVVIRARIEIPERKLVTNLTVKPNRNPGIPASHLVELRFDVPGDFPGRGVANVPGLIMKTTEQARGDPLVGASAKIAPGFFWIALAQPDADKTRNVSLMRERAWIDIPILYDTQKRAILTLEKGGTGERVVGEALAAWTAGG